MSDANAAVALDFMESLARGDASHGLGLLSDDCRFYRPGHLPLSGWCDRDAFMAHGKILSSELDGAIEIRIGEVTSQDDRVCIEAESVARLKNGKLLEQSYHMLFRVRDGKIVQLKEYFEPLVLHTSLSHPLLSGDLTETWESGLDHVTRSFQGHLQNA